jgi:hypothetical protein
MTPSPFKISFDPAAVEQLRQRVRRTQWAPERHGAAWEFGVPGAELRRLAGRWVEGFDFTAAEVQLNRLPHFRVSIDGCNDVGPGATAMATLLDVSAMTNYC